MKRPDEPGARGARLLALASSAVGLGVIALLTRLSGFFVSFYNGDEATYSALASRILTGALPYAGAVDHKPPGIELTYAAIYGLVGRNQLWAVRAVLLLAVVATGSLLARLGERLTGRREGRLAGPLYVLASVWGLPGHAQAANTELLLNLPLVAAAMLFAAALQTRAGCGETGANGAPRSAASVWLSLLAAGALTGVAGLYKYQASLAGAAWAVAAVVAPGTARARVARLAALACGFLAVAAALVGCCAATGTLDAFVFWGWRFNFLYMSKLDQKDIWWNAARFGLWIAVTWIPLLVGVAWPRVRGRPDGPLATALVLAWLGAGLLATSAGGRFFPHYYLMALPALCLLVSPERLLRPGVRRKIACAAGALLTVVAAALGWSWYSVKPHLRRYDDAYRAVAAAVKRTSAPRDRVFVWGNSPEVYFYSNRVMGTRFPFCNYHTGKIWGTRLDERDATGTEPHVVPRAVTELRGDLERDPPLLIVDAAAGRLDRFDLHPIARYPWLAGFVHGRYTLQDAPAGVPIYRRRE